MIVSGTQSGQVAVWNAENHSRVAEFKAHDVSVNAVDISPEATKIATGSNDETACIWSLSTGERLLSPLKHNDWVVAAKFSPDGRLVATATLQFVRVYDSRNGSLLAQFTVTVSSWLNYSLAWVGDSKQLFVLSISGYIYRVDVSTGTVLSKWQIYSGRGAESIALASDGTFVATSARSSVSFWDTTTEEQIGIVGYTHHIKSMAMSSNYDLITSGDKSITLWALCGTLPSHYVSVPA